MKFTKLYMTADKKGSFTSYDDAYDFIVEYFDIQKNTKTVGLGASYFSRNIKTKFTDNVIKVALTTLKDKLSVPIIPGDLLTDKVVENYTSTMIETQLSNLLDKFIDSSGDKVLISYQQRISELDKQFLKYIGLV